MGSKSGILFPYEAEELFQYGASIAIPFLK